MPEEKPKYLTDLEGVKFSDSSIEAVRREIIVALHTILSPLATTWVRMDDNLQKLKRYAEDPIWSDSNWTRNAIAAYEEVHYYKKLKEEETNIVIDGYKRMAERLAELDGKKGTKDISFKDIDKKAREILSLNPEVQLRREAGKKSIQDDLNNLFGPEAADTVEDVIKRLEEEKNE